MSILTVLGQMELSDAEKARLRAYAHKPYGEALKAARLSTRNHGSRILRKQLKKAEAIVWRSFVARLHVVARVSGCPPMNTFHAHELELRVTSLVLAELNRP